jgi:hypothetical protein
MDKDFILGVELTKRYGSRTAGTMLQDDRIAHIEATLGRFAVLLWLVINEREWVGRYGGKGLHILTPAELATATGFSLEKVEATLFPLLFKGYLRMSGERAVRAA